MCVVLYLTICVLLLTSCVLGSPETEGVLKSKHPNMPLQFPQQDWWKWHNAPLYNEYWQRESLRPQWQIRQGEHPFSYGPDSQYTFQTYDTPEYFGYESIYPGGRTHFIAYKNQGNKDIVGQTKEPWNKFPEQPVPDVLSQFQDGNN